MAASVKAAASARGGAARNSAELRAAYDFCGRIARSHYENFTIASWLMPHQMRPHMHAIYAYARIADDFADEARSLAKLDQWEHELEQAYAGRPQHPVMIALQDTAQRFAIPQQPFRDLLIAFRSDLEFKGFETIDDLLRYSRYSANPVGRLVLYLFGYRDPQRQELSDLVCSGLQLANFWQDVAIDRTKGRIYFPRADLRRFEVTERDLDTSEATVGFVELMRYEVARARDMLVRGAELHKLVDRRLSRDVLMFAGGGLAILRAIERVKFNVLHRRPELGKLDYMRLGWNAWWRGRLE